MFTVYNIMERVGNKEPGKVMMYIQDGFRQITASKRREVVSKVYSVKDGVIKYPLPEDMIGLKSVSILETALSEELLEADDMTIETGTNWTNGDIDTFSTAGGAMSITSAVPDQYCYLDDDDIISAGHWYRLEYDCSSLSGDVEFQTYTESDFLGNVESGEDNKIEFRAPYTGEIKIVCTGSPTTAIFDNFSLKEIMIDKYKKIPELIGELPYSYDDQTEMYLNRSEDV